MAEGRRRRASSRSARPEIAAGDRIVDAALGLIARRGWRNLSLAAVASEANLPVLEVYRHFPSKIAILCGFFRRTDEAVLAAPPEAEAGDRPRDRLFDLLMRRFDALQSHRTAVAALRRDLSADPVALLAAGAALLRSMRLMLDAAGIACYGIGGAVAVKLTAAAYLAAAHTWARDETADLAPTMAALDRRLRRIEGWLRAGRRSAADPEAAKA